jgi:hypothetical protein
MSVDVCDTLEIEITLSRTVWRQTVTNSGTHESVIYDIDMQNQAQNLCVLRYRGILFDTGV